jgi:hypothetical protein
VCRCSYVLRFPCNPVTKEGGLPRKRGGHGASANRRAADLYAYEIAPIIAELKASGIVLPRAIADELRKRQVRTARGGAWHPTTVARLLARLRSGCWAAPRESKSDSLERFGRSGVTQLPAKGGIDSTGKKAGLASMSLNVQVLGCLGAFCVFANLAARRMVKIS